ncbi:CPBP family glutamic-type intramembrane protease [Humisphaera borealis]|uniref:CPBP family intramembrane metalloprotease n=1 Tax=Humisphaera borealis TaxID=2807512 RepID=A0A7M2WX40_9BACT|nr:CPBP family glutamic-type intramembrane protease [Humisphaera borealis]QOV90097.1 CPBP family intramembrane metalloprotease [Humisphaera borealis]
MSLLVLLPFVIVYELYAAGLIASGPVGAVRSVPHITAFLLIEDLFRLLGVVGRHLPAFALTAMLLGAHVLRNDRWRFHPAVPFAMGIEGIAWAVPLLIFGWVMARFVTLGGGGIGGEWAILCVGAGIYEEMVFRLMLASILLLILKDLVGVRTGAAVVTAVVVSGVLFALYHYLSPAEDFRLRTCLFRTGAGVYFGALFLLRGFGVTAICHMAYDIFVVGILSQA